ncbi:hypothetical protein DACRYDRAFT_20952 [Dacryopinax primogenitus]|uniref:Cora-domain-containing protein n=1 Tax=Dacryopinax primogenitus (strain DJM 731) TaxID=1858805 RepID=M5GDB6_DACPD|nr:uncharacterized protein DACRYDRAFT_20952 [Dacryopinax primogenitus]EJU04412.1 hypothetical protein DACRYDRAFT_20952 [Dacryopinax primogenitus]
MTPAALLRSELGSPLGSGVNLSLLNTLHQNLAFSRNGEDSVRSTPLGSPLGQSGFHPHPQAHHPQPGHGHQPLALPSAPSGHSRAPQIEERSAWWLDVASPTPSDMRALGKVLHLHPLTLEDILFQDPREKLDLYPRLGYYFVTFSALPSREEEPDMPYSKTVDPDTFSIASNASDLTAEGRWEGVDLGDLGPSKIEGVQVYMVVFADGIVTFHFHDLEKHLRAVRERALRLEKMFPILADWIAHGLVDSIVDAYLPIIKRLERETDRLASLIQSFQFAKSTLRAGAGGAKRLQGTSAAAAAAYVKHGFERGFEGTGEEGIRGRGAGGRDGEPKSASLTPFENSPVKTEPGARAETGSGSGSGDSSRKRRPEHDQDQDQDQEDIEMVDMVEKTNRAIDLQVAYRVAQEQEMERLHSHVLSRPVRHNFPSPRAAYGVLVSLLPHRALKRVMSIDPPRPKPPHPRVVTLYRIASARRMVTSISRLLVHKPVVLSSLRRRFAGVKGVKGDVGVYLDDVEDHIIGMQQALAYCDGTLSQLHPGYLSQLKVAFENAKNGMDKRLLILSLISISILTIQVWIGLFSMNVTVPTNLPDGGFEIFGFVFLGMILLLTFVMALVWYWWDAIRRKSKERKWKR